MKISSFTHKGMVRKNNEDSCLVIPPWSGLSISKGGCLFAVADGMGGQNAGEVASGIAVNAIKKWFRQSDLKNLSEDMVEELLSFANQNIWEYSQKHPETSGMGTTLTLVVVEGQKAIIGHIGDSRLYRFRKGALTQLTNDHSLVAEQVRMGKLSEQQARVHPTRHILSRVLGVRQFIRPDVFPTNLEIGDVFLLCSDGVSGMIDDEQIKEILLKKDTEELARSIVDSANSHGGKDNCTAVAFAIDHLPVSLPGKFSISRIRDMIVNWRNSGMV